MTRCAASISTKVSIESVAASSAEGELLAGSSGSKLGA